MRQSSCRQESLSHYGGSPGCIFQTSHFTQSQWSKGDIKPSLVISELDGTPAPFKMAFECFLRWVKVSASTSSGDGSLKGIGCQKYPKKEPLWWYPNLLFLAFVKCGLPRLSWFIHHQSTGTDQDPAWKAITYFTCFSILMF